MIQISYIVGFIFFPIIKAVKGFCPSHRIRESELDTRVQQYTEELRSQWTAEQADLRRLHRLWGMKRPAINAHNTDLKKRLLAYAKEYPELCQLTEDDEQGGLRFELDKHRIGIRLTAPYSPERRAASSQRGKKCGIQKKLLP